MENVQSTASDMEDVQSDTSDMEADLQLLVDNVLDWQYMHGMIFKALSDTGRILAGPVGVALFPTPFPKDLFEVAMSLQPIYNKLYIAVARDWQWLRRILRKYSLSRSQLLKAD